MRRALCATVALCALTFAAHAFAQAPASTVDVGGLYGVARPYLIDIASTLIVIAGGYITNLLRQKFNLDIDASHRDTLQTAFKNGAGLVINSIGNDLQGKTVDVGSTAVADAVNMVIRSAPDALDHFGITPDSIAQKIVSKIPQVANTSEAAAPAAKS